MKVTTLATFLIFSILSAQQFNGDFACECGCNVNRMNQEFLNQLKKLEKKCSQKFYITSGYRCSKYNREVGGYSQSKHMSGMAVDIRYRNKKQLKQIRKYASRSGYFTFVLDEGNHIHIERGYGAFRYKTEKGVKRYNESIFAGYGKNKMNSYYRVGYISSYLKMSNVLFFDKLDKSTVLNSKSSFGLGFQMDTPFIFDYISLSLAGGYGKHGNLDTRLHFSEQAISIGFTGAFLDIKIEFSNFYPINYNELSASTNVGFNISVGTFNY